MPRALSANGVTIQRWLLWMIAILGVLIYVIMQMVPGLDPGVIKWILLGAGLVAGVLILVGRAGGGGFGLPPFRRVRFFNTTDTDVEEVKIEAVPPQPPSIPPPDLPQPPMLHIKPDVAVFHDAPPGASFYQDLKKVKVTVFVPDPHGSTRHQGSCVVSANPAAKTIVELHIILGGTGFPYAGSVYALCGDNLVPTQPVPIQVP